MKELTRAKIMMSKADAVLLASGGTNDFTPYSDEMKAYRPVKADRLLQDGEQVTLGGVALTCHLTPGHTKGCTTWTMDVAEAGEVHHVLFFGSTSLLPGIPLLNNPRYPGIADDFRHTYSKLKALPCDVFLAPHAGFFGLAEKARRLEAGEKPNPFIDPNDYRKFISNAERVFLEQLEREATGKSKSLSN
ncbi:MAG: Metallo-beta-lactamase precursor [Pedosphaera sp.]|nr:Metallo-beta-lactamase precursor [Pedosphaera sp.]